MSKVEEIKCKIEKVKYKIEKSKNINEIILVWYIFSFLLFLSIFKFFGINIYRIIFIINIITIFMVSLAKNKKLILKNDILLLTIGSIIFIIDIACRRNEYTIGVYYEFIKKCYIPCYLFNRATDIKAIIRYLSFFSKITIAVYIWDPLFNYYFSDTYMGYGGVVILPSFLAIYINYFFNKKNIDIIFLIFGFLAIFIYGNRTCLLAIILMIFLTNKWLLKNVKNLIKEVKRFIKDKYKEGNRKKHFITIFVVAILIFSILLMNKNVLESLFSKSYSLNKYGQLLSGKFETIFSGRAEIYSFAINTIKKSADLSIWRLFFGNGTGYFMSVNNGVYSHSIIFDLIIEYGIVGLLLYLGTLIYCLIIWGKHSKEEKFLLGTYLLCLSFPKVLLSSSFQKETYLWLFIIFSISYFSGKVKTKTTSAGEEDEI